MSHRSDEYESSSSEPVERTKRKKKTRRKPETYKPEGETTETESQRRKIFKRIGSEKGDWQPSNKVEKTMDVGTEVGTMMNIKVESDDLAFFDRFVCYATARTNGDIKIFVSKSN